MPEVIAGNVEVWCADVRIMRRNTSNISHRPTRSFTMTRHPFIHITFSACALMSFSGHAYADIVQCIDKEGATTYSNAPCETGSMESIGPDAVHEAPQRETAQLDNIRILVAKFAAAEDARTIAWANKRFPERRLASDVA